MGLAQTRGYALPVSFELDLIKSHSDPHLAQEQVVVDVL